LEKRLAEIGDSKQQLVYYPHLTYIYISDMILNEIITVISME